METIEHIRYNRLVHRGGALLHLFDVGQLKLIGRIAASLPPDDFSLLYPSRLQTSTSVPIRT